MNPYEYLFGYKIETFIDRLIDFQVLESYLERRFIREYLWKDVHFVIDEINVLVKIRYDFKYCWEEFQVSDWIWLNLSIVYRPKDKFNK